MLQSASRDTRMLDVTCMGGCEILHGKLAFVKKRSFTLITALMQRHMDVGGGGGWGCVLREYFSRNHQGERSQ